MAELDSQEPYGGKTEPVPVNCPLLSTPHTHTNTLMYILNNVILIIKIKEV